ncbi:MAG: hypothetical protein KDK05_31855, partial [Candidatus Competibacteraceae bacterium]|nr:hypothetical protein [Candidatus Competibacteraceae bacterium]
QLGTHGMVQVDTELRALSIVTSDATLLQGSSNGAAIYIGSEVLQGKQRLGVTVTEPYVVLEQGRIISLSGQPSLRIGFRTD